MWALMIANTVAVVTLVVKGIHDTIKSRIALAEQATKRDQEMEERKQQREQEAAERKTLREQDRLDREEDRLDRQQFMEMTKEQLDGIHAAGGERARRLIGEVIKTRGVSIASAKAAKEAYKEANNVNQKIENLNQRLLDDRGLPMQAEVTDDFGDRVRVRKAESP